MENVSIQHLMGSLKIRSLEMWIAFIAAGMATVYLAFGRCSRALKYSVVPCLVVKGQY